jgi:hypothetical protein
MGGAFAPPANVEAGRCLRSSLALSCGFNVLYGRIALGPSDSLERRSTPLSPGTREGPISKYTLRHSAMLLCLERERRVILTLQTTYYLRDETPTAVALSESDCATGNPGKAGVCPGPFRGLPVQSTSIT